MLFDVTHTIEFSYTRPVFLEPHSIRLRPRDDGSQRLLSYDLKVEPSPAGLTECTELDGNVATRAWFDGLQERLKISTAFKVETLRRDPFDFILEPTALDLPMTYSVAREAALAPYLHRAAPSEVVTELATSVSREVDRKTLPFLGALTVRIHGTCQVFLRPVGDPWPPATTLAQCQGSCRDLAVLEMDACRSVGLAARFVSGYEQGDPSTSERELHAWVEVYLPGAGWRGYDPTHGVAVSDRHVAIAAGPAPEDAAPTTGTFRGTGVTSTLRTAIGMTATAVEP